jgi:hypothetical protein
MAQHPVAKLEFEQDEHPSEVRIRLREDSPPTRRAPAALARVPAIAVSDVALRRLPLDHRAGFLLSLIDGESTLETIVDESSLPADEALAILEDLYARGVIQLRLSRRAE